MLHLFSFCSKLLEIAFYVNFNVMNTKLNTKLISAKNKHSSSVRRPIFLGHNVELDDIINNNTDDTDKVRRSTLKKVLNRIQCTKQIRYLQTEFKKLDAETRFTMI